MSLSFSSSTPSALELITALLAFGAPAATSSSPPVPTMISRIPVDEATTEVGGSYVVVDTGPWIFGKKVLLPAGVIDRIDIEDEKVYVDRTKDEIKNAPEFDESQSRDTNYRNEVGTYYGPGGAGYREAP